MGAYPHSHPHLPVPEHGRAHRRRLRLHRPTALYRVTHKRQDYYAFNDAQLEQLLDRIGRSGVTLQRFKGLGEMNPSNCGRPP